MNPRNALTLQVAAPLSAPASGTRPCLRPRLASGQVLRAAWLTPACVAAALSCAAAVVMARDAAASEQLVRDSVDGHRYQNGGIGRTEVAEMRRHVHPYDLRLTFSEGAHNDFVTGVGLRVETTSGQPVFGLRQAGPLTDVSLPAGAYRVRAEWAGITRVARVEIAAGRPAELNLHWDHDKG